MKRLYPEFQHPLESFHTQYARLVQLAGVAEQMKDFGVRLDFERTNRHMDEAQQRAAIFTEILLKLANLERHQLGAKGMGTTKAVKDWFKAAGAPDVAFDKLSGEPQFNAAALTCWAEDYKGKPFSDAAAALLGLRKAITAGKFAGNYHIVAFHSPDKRVHFDFNILGTKGERWSASAKFRIADETLSLNAQNVPNKETFREFVGYGKLPLQISLRDCFIPDDGCSWYKYDYEGAEARLLAYYTQDSLMMAWVNSGADFHTENAKIMFPEMRIPADLRKIGKEHSKVWQDARAATKPATYGLAYNVLKDPGGTSKEEQGELWKQWKQAFPNLTETYFSQAVGRYWKAHKGILAWQYKIRERVEQDGFGVLGQTGKVLYVPQSAKGRNMLANFYMQSGLGALISRAIPDIAGACEWKPGRSALLLQVHDELDIQIPDNQDTVLRDFVSAKMSEPADFDGYTGGVPAEPDVGPDWGHLAPIKK